VIISDVEVLYTKFTNVKLEYLIVALCFFSTGYVLRAFRWIEMLRYLGIKIPLSKNIVIYFTGYAFSLTPGKIGEGIRSKYLKDSFNISLEKTFPTVFSERYYDVIGVIFIIFVTQGLTTNHNILIYLSIIFLVLLYFIAKKKNAEKILIPLTKYAKFNKISKKLLESVDSLEILLKPKIFLISTVFTLVSWTFEAIGAYFVFQSFEIDLGVLSASFLYVLTSFIGAASFLPGGVGGTEGSLLGLLLLKGFSYDDILAPVIMIRFFALWYVIMIGIVFTLIYREIKEGWKK